MYDSDGVKLRGMPLAAQKTDSFGEALVVGIHWYHMDGGRGGGSSSSVDKADTAPSLCIAFDNGLIQLSRGDDDPHAIIVNTELKITYVSWDSKGWTLAVAGAFSTAPSKKRGEEKDDGGGKVLRCLVF